MPEFDPDRYMSDTVTAWNEHAPERNLAYYADDPEYYDSTMDEPARGRDGLAEWTSGWFGAFEDVRWEKELTVKSGTDHVLLFRFKGRHTGPLETREGRIDGTGKSVDMRVADFITTDEQGKIVKDVVVFELQKLLGQVGAAPAKGREAEPRA